MDREVFSVDFSLLPPHIITQILGYLNLEDFKNASCTCKSWHYASTDPQIVRTLILQPTKENIPEICKSNRRYGILRLHFLAFDNDDSYYFELFEKFCPFIHELHVFDCIITMRYFFKLFELSSSLETFLFSECADSILPNSFRLNCDDEAKKRIIRNLSGVKNIVIDDFLNIQLITNLLRYATNLETFKFRNDLIQDCVSYQEMCTVFDNDNTGNLKHLNLEFSLSDCVDDFLTSFVKIKYLNLKSLRIVIRWVWEDDVYKSSLFRLFVMKLNSLVELSIFGLEQDQLSLICQYMVNLKSLDCFLNNVHLIYELGNLKHLEKLRCRFSRNTFISLLETDKFFQCKFENLRLLNFEGFVTEPNLMQLCEYHPKLIELKLTGLLTRNLEIIFKGLTKLRVLAIYFGFTRLKTRLDLSDIIEDTSLFDSKREYHYKISRLQDLEEFHLDELVNGVREDDVKQLKKLRLTNLPELFRKIEIDHAKTPNCMV